VPEETQRAAYERFREALDALDDPAPAAREWAQAVVRDAPPAVVRTLVAQLSRGSAARRADAAEALGRLGDPAHVPALCSQLRDPDLRVRERSAWALARLGDPSALPALRAALQATFQQPGREARGFLRFVYGVVAVALVVCLSKGLWIQLIQILSLLLSGLTLLRHLHSAHAQLRASLIEALLVACRPAEESEVRATAAALRAAGSSLGVERRVRRDLRLTAAALEAGAPDTRCLPLSAGPGDRDQAVLPRPAEPPATGAAALPLAAGPAEGSG
jgi:hypothetical protein